MAEPEAPPTARESDEASPLNALTSIAVEGFKSFLAPTEIAVRPLTILAGANSSGKSSIMQPLLLLKQTQEVAFDPGPLHLAGPNVVVTSAAELLSRSGQGNVAAVWSCGLMLASGVFQAQRYALRADGFVVTEVALSSHQGQPDWLAVDATSEQIEAALTPDRSGFLDHLFAPGNRFYALRRQHGFYAVGVGWDNGVALIERSAVREVVQACLHVPGIRSTAPARYPRAAVDTGFPGRFDVYVGSLIERWTRGAPQAAELDAGLRELGVAKHVTARLIHDNQVEVLVSRQVGERAVADDLVNLGQVGFGVSQVLPVVVALLAAEPGQTVYLEQPELHLHPRAQVALAGLLVNAANRGVRVIAETHSDLLLTGLLTAVAEGRLATEDAILHWFQRDPATGLSTVTSREVDDAGSFGDWPEDFGEVSLAAQSAYLDAAQRRQLARLHAD